MMRATPYCRLSPSAISAYIPPSTAPLSSTSSRNIDSASPGSPAAARPSPRRLGINHGAGPGLVGGENGHDLPVLPLTGRPRLDDQLVCELELTIHGLEGAGGDCVADPTAIDLAYGLKGGLQHLHGAIDASGAAF